MTKKGIDTTFIHSGIRKEDMRLIESLCVQHELDSEWMAENILKAFHEQKVKNLDVDDSSLEKLINSALQKIK